MTDKKDEDHCTECGRKLYEFEKAGSEGLFLNGRMCGICSLAKHKDRLFQS